MEVSSQAAEVKNDDIVKSADVQNDPLNKSSDDDVDGKKVKPLKIDIHTHFMPKSLPDFATRYGYSGFVSLDIRADVPGTPRFGKLMKGSKMLAELPSCTWDLSERLADMANAGIDIQVLSPLPALHSYWAKADDTADLCRIVNNSISREISRFKSFSENVSGTIDEESGVKSNDDSIGSFVGLGIVPMQATELAIIELERCVKELGFAGVQIGTHVNEWNLDAPELAPFWEACEDLGCCVFVHPWDMDVSRKDRKYWLPHLIGMPHETNRAITTLILGGVLEKFPQLKICFSDGGGSFPYIHGRVQQGFELNPEKCAIQSDLSPEQFLGKFYCDTVVGSSRSLELLIDVIGEKNVIYGTNYPFVPGNHPIVKDAEKVNKTDAQPESGLKVIEGARNVNDDVKRRIYCLNALEFLGISQERMLNVQRLS